MFISQQEELDAFCARAASSKVLALDTEFLREKTFYPKLCLVQLAISPEDIAAVDPLAGLDLTQVAALLADDRIVKIIHSCSQDIEVIDHALGVVVTPVFDTQVAAAFLGHRMQLGYGPLVESYTGVHLAKTESLTDWSRRPLDPEQLSYAEDDVRYLPGIYDEMLSQLVEKGRLSWVMPEMESLSDPRLVRNEPRDAYLKLKRSGSLTRRQLGVAREACAWREAVAARRDVPRRWVLADEVLLEVAKRMPKDEVALRHIRGTEQLGEGDSSALLVAVGKGRAAQASELPPVVHHARPSAELESVLDLMYALVRLVSEDTGVAAQLIASRDDLLEFVQDRPNSRLSESWRAEVVGDVLERLLAGELGLTVKDGRVEVL